MVTYVVAQGENTYVVSAISFVFISQSSGSARVIQYSNGVITDLAGSTDSDVIISAVDSTHIRITNNHTWNLRMIALGTN